MDCLRQGLRPNSILVYYVSEPWIDDGEGLRALVICFQRYLRVGTYGERSCPGRSQLISYADDVPQETQGPYILFWCCTERHGADTIAPSRTITWLKAARRSEIQCAQYALQMLQPLTLPLPHAGTFHLFEKFIQDPIRHLHLHPNIEYPPPPVHTILRTCCRANSSPQNLITTITSWDRPDLSSSSWFLVRAGQASEGEVDKVVARMEDLVSEGTASIGCNYGGGGHGV